MASLAHVYVAALTGDEPRARELVTPEFEALMWNDFQYAHMMAQSHALLSANDEALRRPERAVASGFLPHRFLGEIDPLLAPPARGGAIPRSHGAGTEGVGGVSRRLNTS